MKAVENHRFFRFFRLAEMTKGSETCAKNISVAPSALLCILGTVFLQSYMKKDRKTHTPKKKESSYISFAPHCQTEGNISKVYLEIVLRTAFTGSFATCSKLEQL